MPLGFENLALPAVLCHKVAAYSLFEGEAEILQSRRVGVDKLIDLYLVELLIHPVVLLVY